MPEHPSPDKPVAALCLCLFVALFHPSTTYAVGAFNNYSVTSGRLGAVTIKKDSAGNPILAEYASDGSLIGPIDGFNGVTGIRVMSAQEYNAMVSLANQLKDANPGSRLMSVGQYNEQSLSNAASEPAC